MKKYIYPDEQNVKYFNIGHSFCIEAFYTLIR